MQLLLNPLIARLRVGSILSTQKGTRYRVLEPVVEVAPNGGLVPSLVMERTPPGGTPHSVLMPVGRFLNLMRTGVRHKPGAGAAIDWETVQRREMPREGSFLRRF